MRALLSTIGSRGDVQPLVALGLASRELGHEVRLCVPPDFRTWIEGLGMAVTPIGPELRSTAKADPAAARPTPEQIRQMMESTVAAQLETITAARAIATAVRDDGARVAAQRLVASAPRSR